jgi:hypothetical protein
VSSIIRTVEALLVKPPISNKKHNNIRKNMERKNEWLMKAMPWLLVFGGFLSLFMFRKRSF